MLRLKAVTGRPLLKGVLHATRIVVICERPGSAPSLTGGCPFIGGASVVNSTVLLLLPPEPSALKTSTASE